MGDLPRRKLGHRGFTLVEVLVALAVVAIAVAALAKGLGQGLRIHDGLPDRLVAHWIAENRLTLHQGRNHWPEVQTREGSTRMAGREWTWQEKVAATDLPTIRRVTVQVRRESGDRPLATLEGYLSNPAEAPAGSP